MTMTIKIGNAVPVVPEWDRDDRDPPRNLQWNVQELVERVEGAPSHGYNGNTVGMGGYYLAGAIKEAGLSGLFWGSDMALMYDWEIGGLPSGVVGLTERHAEELERAVQSYQARNSNAKPGLPWDDAMPGTDHVLAKIEWFAFWTRWAVTNCRHPALQWSE